MTDNNTGESLIIEQSDPRVAIRIKPVTYYHLFVDEELVGESSHVYGDSLAPSQVPATHFDELVEDAKTQLEATISNERKLQLYIGAIGVVSSALIDGVVASQIIEGGLTWQNTIKAFGAGVFSLFFGLGGGLQGYNAIRNRISYQPHQRRLKAIRSLREETEQS